ncbi:hypothetical protein V8G57_23105 [Collimonas sp. H4R21]|uniref:Uncharacterized protein n=1 Tax=Collimonas rhizosphaerae TaxID=3126357 RepID=A0ABU9Q211_9BURK
MMSIKHAAQYASLLAPYALARWNMMSCIALHLKISIYTTSLSNTKADGMRQLFARQAGGDRKQCIPNDAYW